MAISLPREISSLGNSSSRTRRPSLYAAFTVACVVQILKERLKSRAIGSRLSPQELLTASASCKSRDRRFAKDQDLQHDSLKPGPDSLLKLPPKKCSASVEDIVDVQTVTTLGSCGDRRQNLTRILLDKLDNFAPPQRVSTATIAADDSLFLGYNARDDVLSKGITTLGKILDITSALLGRLQSCFGGLDGCATKYAYDLGLFDGPDLPCRKTAANLEHMLLCLQSAALESLNYCYLKIAEAEFVHWHSYWQQRWQTGDAWFAEWPSGRRPLSTTWPWNVKPSLLVLWGVCWMFYGNERLPRKPQAAEFFSRDFRTGQPPPHVPPQFPTGTGTGRVWASTTAGNLQNLVESHPQNSSRKINSAGFSDYYTLPPAFSPSVSSSPYISTSPSTSSTSFATLANCWPHNQGIIPGIDAASDYTYALNYNLNPGSRLPHESNSTIQRSVSDLELANSADLYAAQCSQAVAYEPRGSVTGAEHSLGHPNSNMPGYPSPHSDMSDHRVSPCPSVFPAINVTSATAPYTTGSRASSTYGSPQSARSEEPTRNDEGVMYCKHKKCEDKPPTFTRKCEWSKHMDKHNRPYICEERGCEKILGFTYSGGLLRHQREVHRQHGGPKAACMCPHSDCKRSTGAGFSRRENLIEHLRRRHRGVEDLSTDSPRPKGPEKKRRRASNDETEDENEDPPEESKRRKKIVDEDAVKDQSEPTDLQAKVKQLELELQQKDERLRRLEEMVERLAQGQPNL